MPKRRRGSQLGRADAGQPAAAREQTTGRAAMRTSVQRTSQESSEWTAHLVQNEALLISGVAEVTVTTGEVECWGTRLSPGSTQLVATSGPDAALSLRAVPTQSKGLARLASADISIRAVSGGCDVGTSLSDLRGVQHDESACPEAWTEAALGLCEAHSTATPARCLLCGPKNVGKSSLAQCLCNELLQLGAVDEVALLEADCGQPAIGAPCFVSLAYITSPQLCAPGLGSSQAAASAFVGDTSAHSHPVLYVQSVARLAAEHAARVQAGTSSAPLVINTPGWVKGLGLSILQDLIAQLQPTHVFAIDGASAHKNLPSGRFWAGGSASDPAPTSVRTSLPCIMQQEGAPAAPLEARPQSLRAATSTAPAALDATAGPEQVHRSASSARSTRFHAWVCSVLQARLPIPLTEADVMLRLQAGQLADSMAQLYGCAPVEVDLQRVPLVSLFEELEDTERAAALNGSLVCLSSISPPGSPGALQIETSTRVDTHLPATLALVHCVDAAAGGGGVAYVHTALSDAELERVNVMLLGKQHLPAEALTAGGVAAPYSALFCMTTEGSGTASMKSRRNLARASHAGTL